MNPRHTLIPERNSLPRRTTYSERPSLQGSFGSGFKGTNNSVQTFTENILNAQTIIGNSHLQGQEPTTTKTVIKNDQKTVLTLIGNFLGVLDHTQHVKVEIDNIPEIYRLLKYEVTVSKNLFNPVGAKHTWTQCLGIISWLGELASYFFKSEEKVLQTCEVEWDVEAKFAEAFKNKKGLDAEGLEEIYTEKLAKTEAEELALENQIKELDLATARIEESQKSIEWAEQELNRTLEQEAKEINEMMLNQNEIQALKRQIHQIGIVMKEKNIEVQNKKFQVGKIQRQIALQPYSLQDIRNLIDEAEEYQIKAQELNIEVQKGRNQNNTTMINLISQFNKEKLRYDTRIEALKRNNPEYLNSKLLDEYPINLENLKEYVDPTVPSDSEMFNRSFIYNVHEKCSLIQQDCTEMALKQMHMTEKLEQLKKIQTEKQQSNQQISREIQAQKSSCQQIINDTIIAKQEMKRISADVDECRNESFQLQDACNQKSGLLEKMVSTGKASEANQKEAFANVEKSIREGERIFNQCVAYVKAKFDEIEREETEIRQFAKSVNDSGMFIFKRNGVLKLERKEGSRVQRSEGTKVQKSEEAKNHEGEEVRIQRSEEQKNQESEEAKIQRNEESEVLPEKSDEKRD